MQIARLAFVSVAVLSLACAGVSVRTDYDTATDFSSLKTYAWLDPPLREASRDEGGQSGDPFTQNTLLDKRVRDEVEAWLASHGYRAAAEGETPDFVVRYELVSREVVRDSPVFVTGGFGGGYYGHGYGSGVGYSQSTTYQEGTLILDVGGNKYRVVVRPLFQTQTLVIIAVMTHDEYEAGRWKKGL